MRNQDASPVISFSVASQGQPFVMRKELRNIRNDWLGWVGMQVQVGPNPLVISALGRINATGNNQPHTLKFVDGDSGADVPGSWVTVTPRGQPDTFSYAFLLSPITLPANGRFFLVSHELEGADQWYDQDTSLTTTSDASVPGSIFSSDSAPLDWHVGGVETNHSYGPVDFIYSTDIGASNDVGPSPFNLPTSAGPEGPSLFSV